MSKVPDFIDKSSIPKKFFQEIKGFGRDEDKLKTYCEIVDPEYVDTKDDLYYNYTMLTFCCVNDYLDMVKILLEEKQANVNNFDSNFNSILMTTLFNGKSTKVIQYLLENYSDIINFDQINVVQNDCVLICTHTQYKRSEKLEMLASCSHTDFSRNNDDDNPLTYLINGEVYQDMVGSIRAILSRDDLDVNYRNNKGKHAISLLINRKPEHWQEMCKDIINTPSFLLLCLKEDEISELKSHSIL
eukprot:TRINITY_DN1400_c2_g1_i1.p1 TRINITY_DN1400_c2_g1~~TRINITY_DN1400_c2_g1_i1.p1  ORF type:complete len:244 (-),score=35.34 TRINITY_DN1400_c2_g1_i1:213-944(-)